MRAHARPGRGGATGRAPRSMRFAALRLAAIFGWTILPIGGFAPPAGAETSEFRADSMTVDACSVAPMEQLRFVVTAGLSHAFPIRENREGTTVSLAEPKVVTATCPNLKVDLALTLREEAPRGSPSGPIAGTVRLALTLSTTAAFASGPGKPPHSAAALADAALCVRRVDPVDLSLKGAPAWLTPAWLVGRLGTDLVGHACVDVTSLVYVFLQRGGTLTPAR